MMPLSYLIVTALLIVTKLKICPARWCSWKMVDLRSCWSLVEVLSDIKNVFLKEISRPWFFCSPISSLSPQAPLLPLLTIEQNATSKAMSQKNLYMCIS